MPRKSLFKHHYFPYHVYNRSIDRCFYEVNMQEAWLEISDLLKILSWVYGFRIHAFVLMSNHYHMAVSAPDMNLEMGIRYFQSQFSIWLNKKTGLQKTRFSGRYKWTSIQSPSHLECALRYIYQNPIRAGMCLDTESYPFSSLSGLSGQTKHRIPITPHEWEELFYQNKSGTELIRWSNMKEDNVRTEQIRRALKKRLFAFPKYMKMK